MPVVALGWSENRLVRDLDVDNAMALFELSRLILLSLVLVSSEMLVSI